MDMEGALRARALAGATGAVVGSRVYWDERPQGGVLPDVTMWIVSDIRAQHMKGFQGLQPTRVQVDVRAASFAQKKALKEAVIADLTPAHTGNGIRFDRATGVLARTLNERTGTQFIYRDGVEFVFHHSTS
jgi:hypothetical protein